MTLCLTASSFYSIFTQVRKTFNSIVAFQEGFLKHLGDVATVLLDLGLSLYVISDRLEDNEIRSFRQKNSLDYYN